MNTTQLECFLAVTDFLNFSRAAERLQMTQPAVSHQINTLEDELGVKLFHRNSKRVRLTMPGHLFFQYARQILALERESRERLRESVQTTVLRFGIGCHSFLELRLLKPALRQLRQEFPLLLPVPHLVPAASLGSLLEDGDVQVMFTFAETAPKQAVYRELLQRPVCCLCAPGHPLYGRSSVTVEELQSVSPCAAYPPRSAPPSLLEIQGRVLSAHHPSTISFCDSLETVYALVDSGCAFTVAASLFRQEEQSIQSIPIAGAPVLSFGLAYQHEDVHPALRPFLKCMAQIAAQNIAPEISQ